MKLIFVRHGKTDWGKEKRITGWEDLALNAEGTGQCMDLLPQLDSGFDVIYSSPLKRAFQSAEIFSKHLDVPIVANDDLRERNFGSLVGKTWEQVSQEYGSDMRDKDVRQEYDYRPHGGESAEQVRQRVARFVESALRAEYRKPLIVTHGGVIRMMHFLCEKKEVPDVHHNSLYVFEL